MPMKNEKSPLADRMRPQSLDEFVGQEHILGQGKLIRKALEEDRLPSLILWGPPGSGKTTLAMIVARLTSANFIPFSAVLSGVKEVKDILKAAEGEKRYYSKRTILFVDEIHRFNKAQQDAFLHHVENGTIILIGATTENPSFQVIPALLSRTTVLVFQQLSPEHIGILLKRAIADPVAGLGSENLEIEEDALDFLSHYCHGDARTGLNALESCLPMLPPKPAAAGGTGGTRKITLVMAEEALQRKALLYDKTGEEHYNIISAFIKSMRGSDPDAAVYWMARMLEAGEDPLFIARRMIIFASEDIGNADPQAIQVAVSAKDAFHFVGMPEGWIPLAQAATYLASAPKSNASYMAYVRAKEDATRLGPLPVPMQLRNAPTGLMKKLGYSQGYQYPHDAKEGFVIENYLPDRLRGKRYYFPSDRGYEGLISQRLARLRKIKEEGTHVEETYEGQAHEELTHGEQAHEGLTHEEQAHEGLTHEEQAHEGLTHGEQAHEGLTHGGREGTLDQRGTDQENTAAQNAEKQSEEKQTEEKQGAENRNAAQSEENQTKEDQGEENQTKEDQGAEKQTKENQGAENHRREGG
jgi:putative ATPase